MQTAWILEGEQRRCLRHAELFGLAEVCPGCVADPPPTDDEFDEVATLPVAPTGCLDTGEVERRMVELADFSEKLARSTLEDESLMWHRFGAGTKLLEMAVKCLRAAGQYATTREQEIIIRRRMRELSAMAGKVRH